MAYRTNDGVVLLIEDNGVSFNDPQKQGGSFGHSPLTGLIQLNPTGIGFHIILYDDSIQPENSLHPHQHGTGDTLVLTNFLFDPEEDDAWVEFHRDDYNNLPMTYSSDPRFAGANEVNIDFGSTEIPHLLLDLDRDIREEESQEILDQILAAALRGEAERQADHEAEVKQYGEPFEPAWRPSTIPSKILQAADAIVSGPRDQPAAQITKESALERFSRLCEGDNSVLPDITKAELENWARGLGIAPQSVGGTKTKADYCAAIQAKVRGGRKRGAANMGDLEFSFGKKLQIGRQ